ncbi:MAG: phosphotransacetylase family protein [Candidatus Odinarchaeota archaeon]|nr:phosphotransacetylase family protein [Candidatus Odinarchaeota archaeon]
MKNLFIVGCGPSGKTSLSLGLSLIFKENGYKVGYFKPISAIDKIVNGKAIDFDVKVMKKALELTDSEDDIGPIRISDQFIGDLTKEKIKSKVSESYQRLINNKDFLIIEAGRDPDFLLAYDFPAWKLATQFNSKVLLVGYGDSDHIVDKFLFYKTHFKDHNVDVVGAIINYVPYHLKERMNDIISPFLENNGVRVLGVVPQETELISPTVRSIVEILGGELLEGHENIDRIVEDILVGAMTPEAALKYFRRSINKAVITGGDRADLAIAALETNTSILILTGGLFPSQQVLIRAKEKGVPVLLVPYDTYTTVTKLEGLTGKISPDDAKKIEATKQIISKYVEWKVILDELVE